MSESPLSISSANDGDLARNIQELWERNQQRWNGQNPEATEKTVLETGGPETVIGDVKTEVGARGAALLVLKKALTGKN